MNLFVLSLIIIELVLAASFLVIWLVPNKERYLNVKPGDPAYETVRQRLADTTKSLLWVLFLGMLLMGALIFSYYRSPAFFGR